MELGRVSSASVGNAAVAGLTRARHVFLTTKMRGALQSDEGRGALDGVSPPCLPAVTLRSLGLVPCVAPPGGEAGCSQTLARVELRCRFRAVGGVG